MSLSFSSRFARRLYASHKNAHSRLINRLGIRSFAGGEDAPYRPWPNESYTYPLAAKFWGQYYPSQSAKQDEFPEDEIYLDELEKRMRTYDKKYSNSEEYQSLHNEFGFEDWDDRAFATYGGGLSSSADDIQAYGRGKKINVAHYFNPDFAPVNRGVIPPVQFMNADQVRRARGSLASFREFPAETPSILKTWNAYQALGAFLVFAVAKETLLVTEHDFFEMIMLWGVWGFAGSVIADWLAWWHTLLYQESYDKNYFKLSRRLNKINDELKELANRPSEKNIYLQLLEYRKQISERVLQKTLANRLTRIMDDTTRQLKNKLQDEETTRASAEKEWRAEALAKTLEEMKSDSVKRSFGEDALRQFTSGDTAKMGSSQTVMADSSLFGSTYDRFYNEAKSNYLQSHVSAGTLPWVFVSDNERSSQAMTGSEKVNKYEELVAQWSASRNSVDAPTPSFA